MQDIMDNSRPASKVRWTVSTRVLFEMYEKIVPEPFVKNHLVICMVRM